LKTAHIALIELRELVFAVEQIGREDTDARVILLPLQVDAGRRRLCAHLTVLGCPVNFFA